MKRFIILIVALSLLLSGCTITGKNNSFSTKREQDDKESVVLYVRERIDINMEEDYNPYIMNYSENGIFYYAKEEDQYLFYFQPYDATKNADCIIKLTGGYVKDLYALKKKDGMHFCILWMEDTAHIYEFDAKGNVCRNLNLGKELDFQGKFPLLLALSEGGYLVGVDDEIFWITDDGDLSQTISFKENIIRKLLEVRDGSVYVVYEKTDVSQACMQVAELDLKNGQTQNVRTLTGIDERVFAWEEDRLISIEDDYVCLLGQNEDSDKRIINLEVQSLLASQIMGIFGNQEEVIIVSAESMEGMHEVKVFRLKPKKDELGKEEAWNGGSKDITGKQEQKEEFSPDGRRIVRVALSSAEENAWEIEHLAKKYNQDSDVAYIETYFYDGSLEDHLGRGNRPDIVMLHDQAAIAPLVERGVLADLIPLYENQDQYSLDDVLPSAREALSVGEGMYAVSRRFELLLRTSDGTEMNGSGECTVSEYLKWYDAYLEKNEIAGMGDLSNLFFGVVSDFYDQEAGKAYFQSDSFKELMKEYKALKMKYQFGTGLVSQMTDTGVERTMQKISAGPMWIYRLCTCTQLALSETQLEGLPTTSGKSVVYMRLQQPLAVLSTSNVKQEAMNYILFACKNRTRMHGVNGGRVDETPPNSQTNADFWVFEEDLKEDIWETDKSYLTLWGPAGPPYDIVDYYLTEERKDMLRELMKQAVGVTKAQNDIYGMFLEEMDGYLNGNKDLESCCDILQNRVSLYLAE